MDKEIFEQLAKYERQMTTASKAKYYVGISPKDIQTIINLHNIIFPNQKENQTTCNACVLRVLSKLADWYFEEKKQREIEEKQPEMTQQEETPQQEEENEQTPIEEEPTTETETIQQPTQNKRGRKPKK